MIGIGMFLAEKKNRAASLMNKMSSTVWPAHRFRHLHDKWLTESRDHPLGIVIEWLDIGDVITDVIILVSIFRNVRICARAFQSDRADTFISICDA